MFSRRWLSILVAFTLVSALALPARGQSVDLGGRAFVDYFYHVSSPDNRVEGLHGFRYRRLYLTTDFRLSEEFSGRARLEANDGTAGPKGPVPFVKDLYITWNYSGLHSATLGVLKPPVFELAEDVWGYRSLEKTIQDLQGVLESRDFGLRVDGPLVPTGEVSYALMYANNSASQPETDKYKRVYGRISATPSDALTLAASADYAEYGDQREGSGRISGFVGYSGPRARVGIEAFGSRLTRRDESDVDRFGGSVFGVVQVARQWELVGRFDWNIDRIPGPDPIESLFVGGVAYRPHSNVAFIPNFRLVNSDRYIEEDLRVRLTVDLSF